MYGNNFQIYIYICICENIYLYLSVYLSIFLSLYLSIYLSVFLKNIYLYIYIFHSIEFTDRSKYFSMYQFKFIYIYIYIFLFQKSYILIYLESCSYYFPSAFFCAKTYCPSWPSVVLASDTDSLPFSSGKQTYLHHEKTIINPHLVPAVTSFPSQPWPYPGQPVWHIP